MEVLTFQQQLEAYAKAQVLVMGHGAAFANIMFMAPVSCCHVLHLFMSYRKHRQPAAYDHASDREASLRPSTPVCTSLVGICLTDPFGKP